MRYSPGFRWLLYNQVAKLNGEFKGLNHRSQKHVSKFSENFRSRIAPLLWVGGGEGLNSHFLSCVGRLKWNIVTLIRLGSIVFFEALYCSCLRLNALLANPTNEGGNKGIKYKSCLKTNQVQLEIKFFFFVRKHELFFII